MAHKHFIKLKISVSVNQVLLEQRHTLRIVYGCFCATVTDVSRCDRDHLPTPNLGSSYYFHDEHRVPVNKKSEHRALRRHSLYFKVSSLDIAIIISTHLYWREVSHRSHLIARRVKRIV